MSTNTERSHPRHEFVAHEFGRLGSDDQHGTDDDVGVETGVFEREGRGRNRLHPSVEMNVDLTQSLEIAVQDLHVRV